MSLVFVISYCFLINGVLFILFSWEILCANLCFRFFRTMGVFFFLRINFFNITQF